jgi:arylsulfatase A-like enzyme
MPGRIPQGRVCASPVGGVDLVPTFFQFAGLELPWPMHGRDLSPLLADPQTDWPYPVLLTATGQKFGHDTDAIPRGKAAWHGGAPWYAMLRDRRYKYVRPLLANDLEELYDLHDDPDELNNLAVRPEHAERLQEMRSAAVSELQKHNAGFVDSLPPVKQMGVE